jgi:hypothetical protein
LLSPSGLALYLWRPLNKVKGVSGGYSTGLFPWILISCVIIYFWVISQIHPFLKKKQIIIEKKLIFWQKQARRISNVKKIKL